MVSLSEVNTDEIYDSGKKEKTEETEEICVKVAEICMKTPKGMCTHVFYKKGASEKEKEEVIAMARDIKNSKGCVVKMYGNNVEFSPFMYDSPSSSPMMVQKLIPKPSPYSPKKIIRGIAKVETNVMTDDEALKIIQTNHKKKEEKKKREAEKRRIVKETEKKMQQSKKRKPIKSNPKL